MRYRVPAETMLRRVSYHGGLPPARWRSTCAAGRHRGPRDHRRIRCLRRPGARYLIAGEVCHELGRDGVLRAVANAEGGRRERYYKPCSDCRRPLVERTARLARLFLAATLARVQDTEPLPRR